MESTRVIRGSQTYSLFFLYYIGLGGELQLACRSFDYVTQTIYSG